MKINITYLALYANIPFGFFISEYLSERTLGLNLENQKFRPLFWSSSCAYSANFLNFKFQKKFNLI